MSEFSMAAISVDADLGEEIAELILEFLGVGPVVELSDDPLEGFDPVA